MPGKDVDFGNRPKPLDLAIDQSVRRKAEDREVELAVEDQDLVPLHGIDKSLQLSIERSKLGEPLLGWPNNGIQQFSLKNSQHQMQLKELFRRPPGDEVALVVSVAE